MGRALLPALAFLIAGNAQQGVSEGLPGFTITRPPEAGWGPIALAIIDLKSSDRRAPGYYCEPDNGDPDTICAGATMFDQRGHIRTLIAATPGFKAKEQAVFRTIGGHAAISIGGGRRIALLEQTDAGYAWVPWRAAVTDKRFCLPEALITRFTVTFPELGTTHTNGDRCFSLEKTR